MIKFIQLICYVSSCLLSGQSIAIERQLIGSTGQSSSIGNFNYDWSIGEVIIDQSNLLYSQGFQLIKNKVISNKKSGLNLNTIITPNNNGKNEYLFFDNLPSGSELKVFDKWGTQLYSSENYNNEFSGLTSKGEILPDGVYIYILNSSLKEIIFKGTITIKRK